MKFRRFLDSAMADVHKTIDFINVVRIISIIRSCLDLFSCDIHELLKIPACSSFWQYIFLKEAYTEAIKNVFIMHHFQCYQICLHITIGQTLHYAKK